MYIYIYIDTTQYVPYIIRFFFGTKHRTIDMKFRPQWVRIHRIIVVMWKLKIGEGNGEDPYLSSTNNFVGRQTWEFDPKAGTPEERAAVEEARRSFLVNRYRVKGCSDLFWRMQVSLYFFLNFITILDSEPYLKRHVYFSLYIF